MRLFLVVLGFIVLLGGGGYLYLQAHPEAMPVLPIKWQLAQFGGLKQRVADVAQQARARMVPGSGAAPADRSPSTQTAAAPTTAGHPATRTSALPASAPNPTPPLLQLQRGVTLYLTNGGVVTGELVRETPQEVVLRWDYGEVGFQRAEIARIVKEVSSIEGDGLTMPWEGQQERWPYQHDVVAKLKKGTVVDAKLTTVTPEALILTQALAGGGEVAHTIRRDDLETLLFRPVQNERSAQIEQTLRTVFPAMRWETQGLFTIVTDSSPPTVQAYRRTIQDLATDWYLTFFPLVKDRVPGGQVYLVMFENFPAYVEYALTDGIPGWLAVGYFSPEDEVLYCFNVLGEQFSQLLYEAYLGQFREARDRISASIKGYQGAEALEGQMRQFLQGLEAAHAKVRQTYTQDTTDTLRHELVHALFHHWGLQHIVLSRMAESAKEDAEQKRRFLQTGDMEQKRKILEELLAQRAGRELPDIRAANSWFSEGLAGYMEPTPVGGVNAGRLADLQAAMRQGPLLPLEFLHTFRMGSFRGMATQGAISAYAQSWALCHFLMSRYREPFLSYLDRLAREQPGEGVDTLPWLITTVGLDQRLLEQEFRAYVEQFPPEDNPRVKQMKEFVDIVVGLRALAAQLWG